MNKVVNKPNKVLSLKQFFVVLMMILGAFTVNGQGVAINDTGNSADTSAVLDVSSTTKGIGLPVFTNASRDTLYNPSNGMLIYNSDTKELNINFSGTWFELLAADSINTQAAGVGTAGYMSIGMNPTPHHSAALDLITPGTHGFLLSNASNFAISQPAEGLITAPTKFRYFDGERWRTISSITLLEGNTGGTAPDGLVGIGTTTPTAGAVLGVESQNKGILPPRMNQTERNAIPSPKEGLFIYNTSVKRMQFWTGTNWKSLLPLIDGIFSDDAGADPYGIFSLDSNDVAVYRDAWRDHQRNDNTSPCNTGVGYIDLSTASITPPSYEQGSTMLLNAPAGGFSYRWTAPNDSIFWGQSVTISTDEAIANLAGEWRLQIVNEDNCYGSETTLFTKFPLYDPQFKKGIFSGDNNNMEVHRLAWKDRPDSSNTTPCSDNLDLSSATMTFPDLEQTGPILMSIGSPIGGVTYTWTSPNDSVYVGSNVTIAADSAYASHCGHWSLRATQGGCLVGGMLFEAKIGLQPITHAKGVFSGTTNNTETYRLGWKNHPDSISLPPCFQEVDISAAGITGPQYEQSGNMALNAPVNSGLYCWFVPNGDTLYGDAITIPADSVYADLNGVWQLKLKDNNCIVGTKDIPVHLELRTNVNDRGIFSGTVNNTDVNRLAWKDHPDTTNVVPCSDYQDLATATISAPSVEQGGNIVLSGPVSTGQYTWYPPTGNPVIGNGVTLHSDSVFASLNGQWIVKVVENYCVLGGKDFLVPISLNNNYRNRGVFSGTTNNMENHRLSWQDHQDSVNVVPCTIPFVDLSAAIITPPVEEQGGNLTFSVNFVAGNDYTWTAPDGREFSGVSGTIPADSVVVNLNGQWDLKVVNIAANCVASGKSILVHFPMRQPSKERGVFSGTTNNTDVWRNEWLSLDSMCLGTDIVFDMTQVNITPPSAEQAGPIILNAPTGGINYKWISPLGTIYNGGNMITIPTNEAISALSGEWYMEIQGVGVCVLGTTDNVPLAVPLGTSHTSQNIFSGTTNNTDVYRNNWKDIPTNPNVGP